LHRLLKCCGMAGIPHGFRPSFRDWAAEKTHPQEVIKAAPAHVAPNKVEAAYARSDLLERRLLMDDWAGYPGAEHQSSTGQRVRDDGDAITLLVEPVATDITLLRVPHRPTTVSDRAAQAVPPPFAVGNTFPNTTSTPSSNEPVA
jgi:hypothetical protein